MKVFFRSTFHIQGFFYGISIEIFSKRREKLPLCNSNGYGIKYLRANNNEEREKKINLLALIHQSTNFEDEVIMAKSFSLNEFIRIRNYYGPVGNAKRVINSLSLSDNTNYIAERNRFVWKTESHAPIQAAF